MITVFDEWVPLIKLTGISEHDLDVLHAHKDFFELHADEIVSSLFDKITEIDALKGIIEEHSTAQRLKSGWAGYWRSLGGPNIDRTYIEQDSTLVVFTSALDCLSNG